jgi:hypothetical protein
MMAGFLLDALRDLYLQEIIDTGDMLQICSTVPTTYAEANATYMLAQLALTAPDYTLADGTTSGRMITVAAQTAIPVTTQGVATYAAITDSAGGGRLLAYSPCTNILIYVGNTVNTTAFKIILPDVA